MIPTKNNKNHTNIDIMKQNLVMTRSPAILNARLSVMQHWERLKLGTYQSVISNLSPQMNRVTIQSYTCRKRAKMTQRRMSKIFKMKYLTSILHQEFISKFTIKHKLLQIIYPKTN